MLEQEVKEGVDSAFHMIAVREDPFRFKVLQYLMDQNLDPEVRNHSKKSPLDLFKPASQRQQWISHIKTHKARAAAQAAMAAIHKCKQQAKLP